jgi:hypothetical protein
MATDAYNGRADRIAMTDPITPLDAQQTALQEQQALHENRLRQIIVATDVLLNVAAGGRPDMTISTRAALAAQHGSPIGVALSKFLNIFQKDHGAKAAAGDEARAQAEEAAEDTGIISPTTNNVR